MPDYEIIFMLIFKFQTKGDEIMDSGSKGNNSKPRGTHIFLSLTFAVCDLI